MKQLLSLLFLACSTLFASNTYVTPYLNYQQYSDANKSIGIQGGVYVKVDAENNGFFELSIESSDISYHSYTVDNNGTSTKKNPKNLRQLDVAFQHTMQYQENYRLKAGYHYIASSRGFNNKAQAALLGIQYYHKNSFDFGANINYSFYSDKALANDVFQFKPYFGFVLGDPRALVGVVKTKISYYHIQPQNVNQNLLKAYNSYEIQLLQSKGKFTNQLIWTFGEQLYAIKQDVLTMKSMGDIHEGSILLSTKYQIDNDISLSLAYMKEGFTEFSSNSSSSVDSITFLAGFKF